MKKILIILFIIAAQVTNMFAMECEANSTQSPDALGRNLISVLQFGGNLDKARKLIKMGANVNYIDLNTDLTFNQYSYSALMRAVESVLITGNKKLMIARELIDNGAQVNLTTKTGYNALILSRDEDVDTLLLDNGADIYQHTWADSTALSRCANSRFRTSTAHILALATRLTPAELNSVKNWLLVDQRLRQGLSSQEQIIEPRRSDALPKDLKRPIAYCIYRSLACDLKERVIKAGAALARELVSREFPPTINGPEILQLLNQHLDLDFLEVLVQAQVAESFRALTRTLELTSNEAVAYTK